MTKKIKIAKNEVLRFDKDSDNLIRIKAILSWTTPSDVYQKYDLDAVAFLLGNDNKLLDSQGMIYYHNQMSPDGSVWCGEDEKEGGEEELYIDLPKLSKAVTEVSIFVTLHKAVQRKQSFKQVTNAKIELYNDDTGEMIGEFHIGTVSQLDDKNPTAVHVGSFGVTEDSLTFHAIEQFYELTLEDIYNGYSE